VGKIEQVQAETLFKMGAGIRLSCYAHSKICPVKRDISTKEADIFVYADDASIRPYTVDE
jgi:hypothetical protein